ncbi:helix-turn-helix domain-containing protein [Massilia pseudoviolaceinigra]|uniref:helix-turn-helix domain-containing protein n=1 Tax=Massilia pseudoviolaceinigra TaxID=3057165 RepID=UPI0027965264|nr:helix-turn-helix domain-containing protein [Massilia sp. CCM 9206]MDQ1923375.1 helix-turn-helix domain-containing protein [Massilia sp. CCM 9206]
MRSPALQHIALGHRAESGLQHRLSVIAPRTRLLVEERFAQWHPVADYAGELGYTEKTLARAVMASMGMSAKVFIATRIALEAKRPLVHTDWSVLNIAEQLGFDEPTNFSKFFKREAGCTPMQFRRRQTSF